MILPELNIPSPPNLVKEKTGSAANLNSGNGRTDESRMRWLGSQVFGRGNGTVAKAAAGLPHSTKDGENMNMGYGGEGSAHIA
jgi:hypothetical protein